MKKRNYSLNETIARHNLKMFYNNGVKASLWYNKNNLNKDYEKLRTMLYKFKSNNIKGLIIPQHWTITKCIDSIESRIERIQNKLSIISKQENRYNSKINYYRNILFKNKSLSNLLSDYMFSPNSYNNRCKINNIVDEYCYTNDFKCHSAICDSNGINIKLYK